MRNVILMFALVLAACQSSDVSRSIGARCDLNGDCDEKCLGPNGDWPGGFCSLSCDTDNDCGDGIACIADQGGVCVFRCGGPQDCAFLGSGYACKEVDGKPAGTKVMVCRG